MKTGQVVILVVLLLLVTGSVWFLERNQSVQEPIPQVATPRVTEAAIDAYIRSNISTLSPEPAVLGGTFYVTRTELEGGSGTVWYEDGHIALIADFTYDTTASAPTITSFTVRPN